MMRWSTASVRDALSAATRRKNDTEPSERVTTSFAPNTHWPHVHTCEMTLDYLLLAIEVIFV